jgi:hypothetical protein
VNYRPAGRLALAVTLLLLPKVTSAQDWPRHVHRDGVVIKVGSDYTLPAGATLDQSLVVVGGHATLNGTVEDDVLVVGGGVDVGPGAVIRGDLNTVGGQVHIDPAAVVEGDVDEATADWGHAPLGASFPSIGRHAWGWFATWATMLRLTLVFVAGLLVVLVAPGTLRQIGDRATAMPGWAFLAGAATELLVTPVVVALCVALVITIIGIPLLATVPLIVGALLVLWLVGFAAIAMRLGQRVRRSDVRGGSVGDFVLGFVLVGGVTLLARVAGVALGSLGWGSAPLAFVGFAIEYVAWTVGLGAALLVLFNRQRGLVPPLPPPLPPSNEAPASAPA